MAEFLVKVADEQGHLRQQVEHGYSEAEVHDRYTQQGYLVYWVKPRGLLSAGGVSTRRSKLKQSTFLIFNQQFLTLMKAGLPILTSLDLLIKRQRDKFLLQLLENVRERVKGGELLSDAFAAQRVFPKIYTTTLLAGEKSGNMEEVLSRYIAYQRLESQEDGGQRLAGGGFVGEIRASRLIPEFGAHHALEVGCGKSGVQGSHRQPQ